MRMRWAILSPMDSTSLYVSASRGRIIVARKLIETRVLTVASLRISRPMDGHATRRTSRHAIASNFYDAETQPLRVGGQTEERGDPLSGQGRLLVSDSGTLMAHAKPCWNRPESSNWDASISG